MKAKKTLAAVAAAIMTVSVASASVFAIDYSVPTYTGGVPYDPTIVRTSSSAPAPALVTPIFGEKDDDEAASRKKTITAADVKKAVKDGSAIGIPAAGAVINKAAVSELAKADAPVSFKNADGSSFSVDPASVKSAKSTDIGFRIEYDEDSIYIYPIGSGDYGFDVNVTINIDQIPEKLDVASARLYHITDSAVEDMGGVNATETGISVTISTRSYYRITGASIEDVSAGAGVNGDGVNV
ncbi:MAG: hypothetical protein J6I96_00605 [Oscillospiraceae bacterium]|nr:hypothetical protein [Oscillospiraceae bacterium]